MAKGAADDKFILVKDGKSLLYLFFESDQQSDAERDLHIVMLI